MSSAEHASRAYVNEFFTLRFDSTSPSSGKQRSRGGGRKGESEANVIIPKTISAYFQDIRSVRNRLFLSYLRRRRSTRRRRTSPPSRGATRRTPTVSGTFCPPMSICPSANRFFFFSLLSLLLSFFHSTHGGGRGLSFGSGLEIAISEMLFQAGRPRPSKKWESPMRPTFLAAADSTSATDDRKVRRRRGPLVRSSFSIPPKSENESLRSPPSLPLSLCASHAFLLISRMEMANRKTFLSSFLLLLSRRPPSLFITA